MSKRDGENTDEGNVTVSVPSTFFSGIDWRHIILGLLALGGSGWGVLRSSIGTDQYDSRISALEVRCQIQQGNNEQIEKRLERIESKIDRFLDRTR